jgi:hypothetical protein
MRRFLYLIARTMGDVNAVKKGKIPRRVGRRIYGKASGRLARRIFG